MAEVVMYLLAWLALVFVSFRVDDWLKSGYPFSGETWSEYADRRRREGRRP